MYARVAGARRRWYERHPEARRCLQQPVISVGNLSVGGTGKTPLVRQLAEWLLSRGERPAILSRGYAREQPVDGVVVVSDGQAILAPIATAGDEPFMLARALPGAIVCVDSDRYLAGALAERQFGATVHLLDDGFQHLQLERDLDILLTSPGEIGGGRVLPFGRLREGAAAAARAGFVVVMDAEIEAARSEAWELGISQFAAARRTLQATGAARAVAVAGIARPEQFFDLLRAAGDELAGTLAFPDHHRYRAKDVARIQAELARTGADVVLTTEKDLVRFEAVQALPFAVRAVPMSLTIDGWDALVATVMTAIERRRSGASPRGDMC